MMSEFTWGGLWLLVDALVGFLSGAEITKKYVCPGNSVAAFQNIQMDNCNANVSLYLNSEQDTLLATWSGPNCNMQSDEYMFKASLDANGTIWIHDIHPWDEAIYAAISVTDTRSSIAAVQIIVMEPPEKKCKPNIMRLSQVLYAYLPDVSNCGKPAAYLFWMNSDDFVITRDQVLPLTPGKEAGTYYVCIEGPALTCVRNQTPQDQCTTVTIEENQSPVKGGKPVSSSSQIQHMRILLFVMVGLLMDI